MGSHPGPCEERAGPGGVGICHSITSGWELIMLIVYQVDVVNLNILFTDFPGL